MDPGGARGRERVKTSNDDGSNKSLVHKRDSRSACDTHHACDAVGPDCDCAAQARFRRLQENDMYKETMASNSAAKEIAP